MLVQANEWIIGLVSCSAIGHLRLVLGVIDKASSLCCTIYNYKFCSLNESFFSCTWNLFGCFLLLLLSSEYLRISWAENVNVLCVAIDFFSSLHLFPLPLPLFRSPSLSVTIFVFVFRLFIHFLFLFSSLARSVYCVLWLPESVRESLCVKIHNSILIHFSF